MRLIGWDGVASTETGHESQQQQHRLPAGPVRRLPAADPGSAATAVRNNNFITPAVNGASGYPGPRALLVDPPDVWR